MSRLLFILVSLIVLVSRAWGSYPVGDLNADGTVDLKDLTILAEHWLLEICLLPGCEADFDGADGFTRYVNGLIDLPFVVGFHWFKHADEPEQGRFDGENSNYGLVTIEDRPWDVLVLSMTQVNAGLEARHAKSKVKSAE